MQSLQQIPTPLNKQQCAKAGTWMRSNFNTAIQTATHDIPTPDEIVIAMACKETGSKWINWIDKYPADVILARCIGDASGDYPGTTRSAFPKNKEAFDLKYGHQFLQMLIQEANAMRAMPQAGAPNGWKPASYLYKGYSIFQYDLQNVVNDRSFFEQKLWYNIDDVLDRYVRIIKQKLSVSTKPETYIALYNGRGDKAAAYARSVLQMAEWV